MLFGLFKELTTPKQPAFDVLQWADAQIKCGTEEAERMRKAGHFNLSEEEKRKAEIR